jgi:hypothetical protein
MLEFHGTCTIIALKKDKQHTLLKLMMGGLNECAQDNFPIDPSSWINAFIDHLCPINTPLLVGDQVRISGIQSEGEIKLTSIRHD